MYIIFFFLMLSVLCIVYSYICVVMHICMYVCMYDSMHVIYVYIDPYINCFFHNRV